MSKESKAAERFQRSKPVICLSSEFVAHSCWRFAQAVIVDLFFLVISDEFVRLHGVGCLLTYYHF